MATLLQQTLEEEKATDEKLTAIAEAKINRRAARSSSVVAGASDGARRGSDNAKSPLAMMGGVRRLSSTSPAAHCAR